MESTTREGTAARARQEAPQPETRLTTCLPQPLPYLRAERNRGRVSIQRSRQYHL